MNCKFRTVGFILSFNKLYSCFCSFHLLHPFHHEKKKPKNITTCVGAFQSTTIPSQKSTRKPGGTVKCQKTVKNHIPDLLKPKCYFFKCHIFSLLSYKIKKQQSQRLEPENICHFCLKNYLKLL